VTGGTNSDGYQGQWTPTDDSSDFNVTNFLVRQIVGKNSTATLVKVTAVTNTGAVAAVGFVDVQPLVNMIDGAGNSTPHGVLHNVPYMRVQGGANAVILDPKVGDVGVAVFADRDVSSVKANKAQANPGSRRRFDMADGLYLGGMLNGVPDQYVRFTDDGIVIADKNSNKIEMASNLITITGNVKITGTLETDGATTLKDALDVQGAATLEQTIDVKGAATLETTLDVTGLTTAAAANFSGAVAASTMAATTTVTAGTNLLGADMLITGHLAYTAHEHPYFRSSPSSPDNTSPPT